MKVYSSDSILSKWKEFVSHLESCYGAVRIEDDEMFMVEFWFQENRKVPRGFSDGDFVKNVYVSLDDFMGEKYVGFSSVVGNIIPENLDKALEYLESWPWGKIEKGSDSYWFDHSEKISFLSVEDLDFYISAVALCSRSLEDLFVNNLFNERIINDRFLQLKVPAEKREALTDSDGAMAGGQDSIEEKNCGIFKKNSGVFFDGKNFRKEK